MVKILNEIMKHMPKDADVSEALFEGANIVLYTKNSNFFLDNGSFVKNAVDDVKKRIEIRCDQNILLPVEQSEKLIKEILPEEAKVDNIIFDPQRSLVFIEAEKPGLAIGKNGDLLKEIRKKTYWVPLVKRTPSIRSPLIENIRAVLYENNDYRKKFLNKAGKRIYDGWTRGKKEQWIRLSFLGSAREVGRSCYLLQTPESRVLLECGLNAAANDENAFPILEAPEFDINALDAVIISHSHIDHVGCLPFLYKMGYKGPVYMTEPVRDVSALLTLDCIVVSQREGKEPIYGSSDVKEMVKHTICLGYEEVTDITPDVRLTFYNAGHTLGSCIVHLHIGNGLHNLVFTGDFNYENSNLLNAAQTRFPRAETVMMEATYGTRKEEIPTRSEAEELLINLVNETINNDKGKVLMPVLGVGRSQEMMVVLERVMREGKIPKVPIYLQGMVWDVTAIHTAYPDFFSAQVKKQIFQNESNPFLSEIFKRVASQKEMKQVIESKEPCIILATSGMLTGGASLLYFKALAENPKNRLILTCYQGPGSLGRRLQDGEKDIGFVEGNKQEMTKVRIDIHVVRGFSGHSSYKQLNAWIRNLNPRPNKIIFVHAEASRALEMASHVYKTQKIETVAPKNLEVIRLR